MGEKISEGNEEEVPEAEEELKRQVSLAARVAKEAHGFESVAFEKILAYLLEGSTQAVSERIRKTSSPTMRRSPKIPENELDRIKTFLDASDEFVSDQYTKLSDLNHTYKIYGILQIAREHFQLDGLTVKEIRHIANQKFRFGIPDGTLRGNLSKASINEIGKNQSADGQTIYRLMRPGEIVLNEAIAKAKSQVSNPPQ